jgi:hypothetical protein
MKVLKSFQFKTGVGKGGTYDWETLLDGKIRQMTEGEDYACKPQTVRMMAMKQGRKRGKVVHINKVEGGLVIQAEDASADQIEAWKEADAEKKAAKAANETEE